MRKLSLVAIGGLISAAALGFFLAKNRLGSVPGQQLYLQVVPTSTSAVVFVNLAELRASPFLAEIYRWAPHPEQDSDYKSFVQSTGFDYERDLDSLLLFSLSPSPASASGTPDRSKPNFPAGGNASASRELFAVAEGRWDTKKLLAYARQNGTSQFVADHEVISVAMKDPPSTFFFSMVDKHRLALSTNVTVLGDFLAHRIGNPEQPEWAARIRRVSGSPVFAVLRQDSSTAEALAQAAPSGFSSPQVSTLIQQLQWITIAAQPEDNKLRLVTEGETLAESTTLQLSDVLKGIVVLAEAGLHDAKTREQLNPALRQAYLELLQSAEVTRLNRGSTKSVRLALTITPKFLETAKTPTVSGSNPSAPTAPARAKAHPKSGI